MNPSDEYVCPYCKKSILCSNALTHDARCENQKNGRIKQESSPPKNPPQKSSLIEDPTLNFFDCPNCLMRFPLDNLVNHFEECEERPVECEFCKQTFPKNLISAHQNSCEKKPQNESYFFENQNNRGGSEMEIENNPIQNQNQQPYEEFKAEGNLIGNRENAPYERVIVSQSPSGHFTHTRIFNSPNSYYSVSSSSNYNNNSYVNNNPNQNNPIPNEMNDFRSFIETNPNNDPFQNFNDFFGPRMVDYPRGFNIRSVMRNRFDFNELPFFLSHLGGNLKKGLTKEEMESLDKYPFVKRAGLSDEDLKCVICYSDFIDHEEIRCLPCFHKFHVACIDKWLENNSKCPICKYDLKNFNQQPYN